MRDIRQLVVHGAYTTPDMDVGVAEIRPWHIEKNYNDIGYHHVIRRNGVLEDGRPIEQRGAHCIPVNGTSIGVCLAGGKHPHRGTWDFNYTAAQLSTLKRLVNFYKAKYPGLIVGGHRDFDRRKCPGFDVVAWASTLKSEVS